MPAAAILDADLSDAEDQALLPPVEHAHRGDDDDQIVLAQTKRVKRKKCAKDDPELLEQKLISYHKTQLRRVVSAQCKCQDANCRRNLRVNLQDFERVLKDRVRIHGSQKLNADEFLFNQILKRDRDGDGHWHVQGHRVCKRAYALIMGIGKSRLEKMTKSLSREESCPIDARFGQPKENDFLSAKSTRPLCMDFLEKIYHELAEPMPDARDDQVEGIKLQVKRRGKRPRHRFKRDDLSRDQIKFLPPGTLLDYLDLCRAEHPQHKIGRKVFNRAFWWHFQCGTVFF